MDQGTSDQPASGVGPLARGFWIGAIFAACGVATGWILAFLADDALKGAWLSLHIEEAVIAILVVGYLAGLVATMRRPTRRLGVGILIGVTIAFPVSLVLSFSALESAGFGGG